MKCDGLIILNPKVWRSKAEHGLILSMSEKNMSAHMHSFLAPQYELPREIDMLAAA